PSLLSVRVLRLTRLRPVLPDLPPREHGRLGRVRPPLCDLPRAGGAGLPEHRSPPDRPVPDDLSGRVLRPGWLRAAPAAAAATGVSPDLLRAAPAGLRGADQHE